MVGKRILSFGYEPGLMTSRTMLLHHAGYMVDEAYSPRAVLSLAQSGLADLILICHSVPPLQQDLVVSQVRNGAHFIPILCINNTGFSLLRPKSCQEVSSAPEDPLAVVSSAVNETRVMR